MTLDSVGNLCVPGAFQTCSDRNVKKDFQAINSRDVLEKLAALQIQTWSYTNDSRSSRHIGPVAQDFQAAFSVGDDDKHIATVDEGGVALVAIQGLHQMVKAKNTEIDALKADLKKLREDIDLLMRRTVEKGK